MPGTHRAPHAAERPLYTSAAMRSTERSSRCPRPHSLRAAEAGFEPWSPGGLCVTKTLARAALHHPASDLLVTGVDARRRPHGGDVRPTGVQGHGVAVPRWVPGTDVGGGGGHRGTERPRNPAGLHSASTGEQRGHRKAKGVTGQKEGDGGGEPGFPLSARG